MPFDAKSMTTIARSPSRIRSTHRNGLHWLPWIEDQHPDDWAFDSSDSAAEQQSGCAVAADVFIHEEEERYGESQKQAG
jgi:hypothetical protein